jgi:hypothetical protein
MAISWSLEELQRRIEIICYAQTLVQIDLSSEDFPTFVLFQYPSRKITRLASLAETKAIHKAKRDKILTEEEMDTLMRERGIWKEEDDKKVESIHKLIELRKKKIADPDVDPTHKPYIQEGITKLEEELFQAELKRERMLVNTAQRRARQEKYDYMLWACCYDPYTDELLWDNYLTYCSDVERKVELKNKLLSEFLRYLVGHTTEEIRYIARSNLWRLDYLVAQKGNLHLFPKSSIELTPDQKNLLWWTGYYQSIYEMLPEDQPDDWVIQEDEALDEYMEDLHKERSKDRSERKAEKRFGSSSAEKMDTRLITRSHPEYMNRKYDKVNPKASDKVDVSLNDDPQMQGSAFKRSQGISKSKKFTKE